MGSLPSENKDPLQMLEPIADVTLESGRLLMEAGANAIRVEEIVKAVAHGLGAECVDLRIGYASLAVTITIGQSGVTRVRKVGHLGVNQRLDQELSHLAKWVSSRELTTEQTRAEFARIAIETPAHNQWVTAIAVGLACAAFGRLLGADWLGTGPVFVAATLGQYVRRELIRHGVNVFICMSVVSFSSSLIGSLGARWMGSRTDMAAMIASILLLVPGVPAVNAQNDILEGRPTLGSARAVTVVMTLIFIAAGLWVGPVLLHLWH